MPLTAHTRNHPAAVAAILALALTLPGCVMAEAGSVQGTFARTLTVEGAPTIEVMTGSGSVEVRSGAEGRIEVRGRIHANDGWMNTSGLRAAERVRRLEENPPIQQSGQLIRIGHIEDRQLREGVSISYTLIVPASSRLDSRTGSGAQTVEGLNGAVSVESGSGSLHLERIGNDVRASTGSGSIEADGVGGAFHGTSGSGSIEARGVYGAISAKTGSGGIDVTQTGRGDVEASSGSGSVRLHGVRGGVRATTGSGGIDVQGAPTSEWRLSASSGSISVALPRGQGFELDATTGSGHIDVDSPITISGTADRRRLRGTVGNGGPLLHVRTSSGGVQIRQ
jgi:hypothetical protein